MNDELMSHLDTIARAEREKEVDAEEIVRRVAYKINLQRFKQDWPELPAPTFLLGISGQWGRGKTSIIIMLIRLWMTYDLFNNVILLSGSGKLDPKMDFIPNTNTDMSYSPENLNRILKDIGSKKGSGSHLAKIQKVLEGKGKGGRSNANKKSPAAENSNSISNSGVGKRGKAGKTGRAAAPNPRKMLRGLEDVDMDSLAAVVRRQLHSGNRNLKEINLEQLDNMTDQQKAQFFRKMVTDKDLIFFDDSSGQAVLERGSPLYQVITMLRHLGISAGFAYHSWKQMGKPFRKQVSTNIVFPCPPEEREAIGEGTELGPTAIGLLLQAMGRLPHVYLVIHDRPDDPSYRYLLNFRVPLSPQMISEVATREQAVVRAQRGSRLQASEVVSLAPDSQDTGGSILLKQWLAEYPQLDERTRPRTIPNSVVPSGMTPREKRALKEAQNLVLQVENFTFPLVPDPAKLIAKAGLQKQMSTSTTRRATTRLRSATSGGKGSIPTTTIRPSQSLARSAAAGTLDPSARIANILLAKAQRRATQSAVLGSLQATQVEATRRGDAATAYTAAARAAAARRNPGVAAQIAKTTARPDLSRLIRGILRRPLGAGTNTLGRFTGRARLGPTGTTGAFRSRLRAGRGGGGAGAGQNTLGGIAQSTLLQLGRQASTLATLQASVEGFQRTVEDFRKREVEAQEEQARLAREQAQRQAQAVVAGIDDDVSMRTAASGLSEGEPMDARSTTPPPPPTKPSKDVDMVSMVASRGPRSDEGVNGSKRSLSNVFGKNAVGRSPSAASNDPMNSLRASSGVIQERMSQAETSRGPSAIVTQDVGVGPSVASQPLSYEEAIELALSRARQESREDLQALREDSVARERALHEHLTSGISKGFQQMQQGQAELSSRVNDLSRRHEDTRNIIRQQGENLENISTAQRVATSTTQGLIENTAAENRSLVRSSHALTQAALENNRALADGRATALGDFVRRSFNYHGQVNEAQRRALMDALRFTHQQNALGQRGLLDTLQTTSLSTAGLIEGVGSQVLEGVRFSHGDTLAAIEQARNSSEQQRKALMSATQFAHERNVDNQQALLGASNTIYAQIEGAKNSQEELRQLADRSLLATEGLAEMARQARETRLPPITYREKLLLTAPTVEEVTRSRPSKRDASVLTDIENSPGDEERTDIKRLKTNEPVPLPATEDVYEILE